MPNAGLEKEEPCYVVESWIHDSAGQCLRSQPSCTHTSMLFGSGFPGGLEVMQVQSVPNTRVEKEHNQAKHTELTELSTA